MESQEDRIINGLLKADVGFLTPAEAEARLSQDVVIRADPTRSGSGDLWPCIWFLAAVLERQFTGQVVIDVGLGSALPSPVPLSSRCLFIRGAGRDAGVSVSLGADEDQVVILGDTRGNVVSYGRSIDSTHQPAHPAAACALAGYLGFSALAHAAGLPPFHAHWQTDRIQMPFSPHGLNLPADFSVLGTGQVGQAFLALAYFLHRDRPVSVHLVDRGEFEGANLRTQVLLAGRVEDWCGRRKVDYLAEICKRWGWVPTAEKTEIGWGWKCTRPGSSIAFLGFDNMDARRVGVEAGFTHLFECGVGTDFCRPRVSWHSLPPDRDLAKELFQSGAKRRWSKSEFAKSLGESPGACGRVVFENIEASAPSFGLVAAAFTWAEVLSYFNGSRQPHSGSAYLWSPLLPFERSYPVPSNSQLRVA